MRYSVHKAHDVESGEGGWRGKGRSIDTIRREVCVWALGEAGGFDHIC